MDLSKICKSIGDINVSTNLFDLKIDGQTTSDIISQIDTDKLSEMVKTVKDFAEEIGIVDIINDTQNKEKTIQSTIEISDIDKDVGGGVKFGKR